MTMFAASMIPVDSRYEGFSIYAEFKEEVKKGDDVEKRLDFLRRSCIRGFLKESMESWMSNGIHLETNCNLKDDAMSCAVLEEKGVIYTYVIKGGSYDYEGIEGYTIQHHENKRSLETLSSRF